jgi:hypothetical protein
MVQVEVVEFNEHWFVVVSSLITALFDELAVIKRFADKFFAPTSVYVKVTLSPTFTDSADIATVILPGIAGLD